MNYSLKDGLDSKLGRLTEFWWIGRGQTFQILKK